jgi:hypothetical protein
MGAYSFDPFEHRPREECNGAALRAEAPDVDVITRVGREADAHELEAWRAITRGASQSR